ncbi:MAG: UvrD-helicase domain-containing protein [Bacteroidales bacterium]|nr:UvrD-helicase domain-containing protein [Bacteroidales bacterium]
MFKTYNASAGSGKTTNLVAEYLSICLQAPDKYRHVLAVTFTNNATAEMKERILQTLYDFAFTSPDIWDNWESQPKEVRERLNRPHFIHQTTRQLSQLDSDTIRERSEALLENILFHYPDFAISTIDSFFQHIIRSFAFELGLNTDFSIEVSLKEYFQQTVDMLFQRISSKNKEGWEIAQRVINLVKSTMENEGKWNIDNALLSLLENIYKDEKAHYFIDLLKDVDFENSAEILTNSLQTYTDNFYTLIEEGKDILRNSGIPREDFYSSGIWDWFDKSSPDELKNYKRVNTCISDGSPFTKAGKADLSPTSRSAIIQKLHEVEDAYCMLEAIRTVRKKIKELHLFFDLQKIIDELRIQDNTFFLSKAGELIQKEIKDNPVPYIYNKVGNRYTNYFIDEFQDTSDTQWENLLPLLDEAVAGNDPNGKDILFGDVKQAIYRFRNGNPQLFAELTTAGSTRRSHFERITSCEEELLDTNHRTCRKIINFNNRFFEQLPGLPHFPTQLEPDIYKTFYATVRQKDSQKRDGFVAVRFCPEILEGAKTQLDYLAETTLKAIIDATKKRNYELRDIAVLTRRVNDGTLIGKYLAENGIAVISADSLVLKSDDNVSLLISMMKYLDTPSDAFNRLQLVHLILKKEGRISELPKFMDTISGKRTLHKKTPRKPLEDDSTRANWDNDEKLDIQYNIIQFDKLLKEQFSISVQHTPWSNLPLLTLTHTLMKEMRITDENSYLIGFIDLVSEYSAKRGSSLNSFLKWWDETGANKAVTSPENTNAVRIMTIHKAKGKEFPVVIMPVLNKNMQRLTQMTVWQNLDEKTFGLPAVMIEKSAANDTAFGCSTYKYERAMTALDETNIIYVGQTRPKDALYLILDIQEQQKDSDAKKFLYSHIINDFICKNEADFSFENDWYWFGDTSTTKKGQSSTEENHSETLSKLPITDFLLSELVSADLESEQQRIGIAVHSYFEKSDHFPKTEEEAEKWTFDEGQPYQDEIRDALKRLTRNTDLLPYFADDLNVLKEVSILTESGERRRPDRVVQLNGETVVIDFKTGEPNESAKKKYIAQVQEYVQLLQEMGFQNVRGELLYL